MYRGEYSESPDVSIHAAREGGDAGGLGHRMAGDVSIHAAREGGDGPPLTH